MSAPAASLPGSGWPSGCRIIRRNCPAASSSASRWRARSRPIPRSWSPTSRPAISTRATGKQIIELLFAGHVERGTTLILVTHDAALARALRPRGAAALRPHRRRDGLREWRRMSLPPRASADAARRSCRCASRLREMRGGLRGFYVFIACIALGVMAIAGVGSFSGSLADGLAREGRVILGGDVVVRADPARGRATTSALSRAAAAASPVAATMRAMARAADGRAALVEIKAVDGAYPLYGTLVARARDAARRRCSRNATACSAPPPMPPCWRGSTSRPATASPSATRQFEIRAVLQSEPDKLAGGIGFGPRLLISERRAARHRPAAARQPGALALSLAPAGNDAGEQATAADRRRARSSFRMPAGKSASRNNASPQLERNVERFTQFLTLVGLTALAGRRRRRRQCGEEPSRPQARRHRDHEVARRDRQPRLRDLSDAGDGARR